MDPRVNWIAAVTTVLGLCATISRGQIWWCRDRGCTNVTASDSGSSPPYVDIKITCGYSKDVIVTWYTSDWGAVWTIQLEYNCRNITGYSKEDALLRDANVVDFSGQSTIPGNWSEGATCTAWGCYSYLDTCAYIMEQSCTIPVTTVATTVTEFISVALTTTITEAVTNVLPSTVLKAATQQATSSIQEVCTEAVANLLPSTVLEAVTQHAASSIDPSKGATTLILVVALITVLLGVVICALIAILMAYRRRKKRKDVHQLAGLANVIQQIEVDLSPQRFDVKSVHSADIVYNNLDFSDERTQEGSIRNGLENILHGTEADQIMCDYVDESPLQMESLSDSVL